MKKTATLLLMVMFMVGCSSTQMASVVYEKGKKVYKAGKKVHAGLEKAGDVARKADEVYLEYKVEKEKKALE